MKLLSRTLGVDLQLCPAWPPTMWALTSPLTTALAYVFTATKCWAALRACGCPVLCCSTPPQWQRGHRCTCTPGAPVTSSPHLLTLLELPGPNAGVCPTQNQAANFMKVGSGALRGRKKIHVLFLPDSFTEPGGLFKYQHNSFFLANAIIDFKAVVCSYAILDRYFTCYEDTWELL